MHGTNLAPSVDTGRSGVDLRSWEMLFYLMVILFVLLLWAIFYVALFTIQRAHENWKRARRLRRSIERIAGSMYWS
jgi:threonine/homoserine/homoserine lactone efflux protein